MAKGSRDGEREERVRRRLVKLQAAVLRAQEKRALVLLQGDEEIVRARQRAETRLAKATERVERRAAELARAEAALRELHIETPAGTGPEPSAPSNTGDKPARSKPMRNLAATGNDSDGVPE